MADSGEDKRNSVKPPGATDAQSKMKLRLPKRRRLNRSTQKEVPSDFAPHFERLPIELLTEILMYTGSSKNVLAVARCSKYLCNTLLDSRSQGIWKVARTTCGLPDPPPIFTDASYAAFVFDEGECQFCKRVISDMYSSFALRLSALTHVGTGNAATIQAHRDILSWTLVCENVDLFVSGVPSSSQIAILFKHDWDLAVHEYNQQTASVEVEAYIAGRAAQIARKNALMLFYKQLHTWKVRYIADTERIREANKAFIKTMAANEGINLWILTNTPSIVNLIRMKNSALEEVTDMDIRVIRTRLDEELRRGVDRRADRALTKAVMAAKDNVDKHYAALKSIGQVPMSLSTFRGLQIMTEMVSVRSSADLSQPPVSDIIAKQIKDWVAAAREDLGVRLGTPQWKATPDKLHPVERVTALFRCQRCDALPQDAEYHDNGCFDFKAACAHECRLSDPIRKPERWAAKQFSKDEKACLSSEQWHKPRWNSICRFFSWTPRARRLSDIRKTMHSLFAIHAIRLSCCMRRVCHRHESMSLALADVNTLAEHRVHKFGLCKRLLGDSETARKYREKMIFQCTHCQARAKQQDTSQEHGVASEGGRCDSNDVVRSMDPARLFNFNGLRSHLQMKHNVNMIRDEDFSVAEKLRWPANS
ncbi:hypothetical protein FISHEDRAFT_59685 [Fistulina hepatica ATCC 64428]|uniref:F-box domain-containing protein n=1 Tax=Fistulina hepatica ATCC 64428 TaxID=1128425 RepID=A0A0D7A9R1_9AGAR|nr:hypothetical protein FISHEDRAFT_59685 [Fistulina hepatica ATCC 64428]